MAQTNFRSSYRLRNAVGERGRELLVQESSGQGGTKDYPCFSIAAQFWQSRLNNAGTGKGRIHGRLLEKRFFARPDPWRHSFPMLTKLLLLSIIAKGFEASDWDVAPIWRVKAVRDPFSSLGISNRINSSWVLLPGSVEGSRISWRFSYGSPGVVLV